MDNNSIITDDDRQTPSNGQSSSDDVSSVTTKNSSMTIHENDQRRMPSIHVIPVKTIDRRSLPNLEVKHICQPNKNLFNDKNRIINDVHVKVSRINRASLHDLYTETSVSSFDTCPRRKSTGTVTVSRANQSTVHVNRTSAATNTKQDLAIASKPMVTRVSFSNELSFSMHQKEPHVTVKHISVNQKHSS